MVFAVSLSRSTNSVAVIGGGVVGAAVAYTLARRGLAPVLLEAEDALALGASGTNSGILHTGFDSVPGALETQLILRSAALRDAVLDELGVPALRCGAVLRPGTDEQADNARRNGVAVALRDGALEVPGETVTDPVAYTLALAAAAQRAGAEIRTGARVEAIERANAAPAGAAATSSATSRSTAPACAPTPSPAWSATTASPSTRARASSSSSTATPRSHPAARSHQAHEGGARVPHHRRQGRRRPHRARPVRQGGLVGAARGPRRGARQGRGDAARARRRRAGRQLRRPAPGGRGRRQLRDRALARLPAARSTSPPSARPGCRPRWASASTWRRSSSGPGVALGADRPLPPGDVRRRRGAVVEEARMAPLILGVDEGTTGVKAALFDERLRPVREARRDKVNRHPQPGWVEQDGEEVLQAVVEAIAELLADAPGEVVACGLDHQGESVLAWDAETGAPLSPDRRLAGQALAGGARPPRRRRAGDPGAAAACRSTPTSRPPSSPGCSSTTRPCRPPARRGTLRMGTVDAFLCDRLGAGFATDPSTASRTQLQRAGLGRASTRGCASASACRSTCCPRCATPSASSACCATTPGRWSCRCARQTVDQQAALAGSGCVVPGRVKATYGTGVFVLAHAGDEVPEPAGGLLPTVAWSIDGRARVRDRRRRVRRRARCSSGCAASSAWRPTRRRSARWRARPTTAAGARVLPALAGIGAPWWKPEARAVLAGLHGGTTRANVARAALRGHRLARGRRGGGRSASTRRRRRAARRRRR